MLDYPLNDLKAVLQTKYPSLIVVQGSDSSFIQVFKPCSSSGKACSLDFLPNFSVIVTINDSSAKFSLMTYHGKVLCVETMDFPFKHENMRLLEMIQSDELRVCKGFIQFAQIEDLALTAITAWSQDWKSPLLLENFGSMITMRSGQCSYICKNKYQLCSECHLLLQINDGEENKHSNDLETAMKCEVKIEEAVENCMEEIKVEGDFDSKMGSISVTMGESNNCIKSSKNSTFSTSHVSFDELENVEDSVVVSDDMDDEFSSSNVPLKSPITRRPSKRRAQKSSTDKGTKKSPFKKSQKPKAIKEDSKTVNYDMDDESYSQEDSDPYESPLDKQPSRTRAKKSSPNKRTKKSPLKKSQKPEAIKDEDQGYQCKVCCLVFSDRYRYLRCMTRHEEVFDLKQSTICPVCRKHIETKLKVTEHFKDFHSDMGETCCCECGLVMENSYGTLRKHILAKHHKAEKALLCFECGQEYHSKARLESHIGKVHSKVANFICQHCGDVFAHRLNYNSHIRRHDPKDLKCLHCDKTFRQRKHLFNHLQMHTKLKPFKCRDCEYSSERKSNVGIHVKKMHGRKWSNKDIVVNEDEAERMKKTATLETRKIVASRNLLNK